MIRKIRTLPHSYQLQARHLADQSLLQESRSEGTAAGTGIMTVGVEKSEGMSDLIGGRMNEKVRESKA